ncbi:MAG: SH3 domain-containing protein [Acidobacteria bacterium]|nr:SH3 domain-containing protein [Acidobacteriota bacterium]
MPEKCTVTRSHRPDPGEPLVARAGDTLRVEERPTEWEGWLWSENPAGVTAWVPVAYLARDGDTARLTRDYSSRELDVDPGETLEVLEEESGWYVVRDARGRTGWVPVRATSPV